MPVTRGTGTVPVGAKVSEEQHEALRWLAYVEHTTVSAIISRYAAEGLERDHVIQRFNASSAKDPHPR
jgi:hypothetical protein